MKTILFVLLFFLLVVQSFCQRPMALDEFTKRLDTVAKESMILYNYVKAKDFAIKDSLIPSYWEHNDSLILTYLLKDTVRTIFINENNECIHEVLHCLNNQSNCISKNTKRSIDSIEYDLIYKKRVFLEYLKQTIQNGQNNNRELQFRIVLLPFDKHYRVYLLAMTSEKNILPLDTSYLFVFNEQLKLKKKMVLSHKFSTMRLDSSTEAILLSYENISFLTLAVDLCNFRLYKHPLKQTDFIGFINRRKVIYNVKLNSFKTD